MHSSAEKTIFLRDDESEPEPLLLRSLMDAPTRYTFSPSVSSKLSREKAKAYVGMPSRTPIVILWLLWRIAVRNGLSLYAIADIKYIDQLKKDVWII